MALENKLNITDSVELARAEEKISKKKAIELFQICDGTQSDKRCGNQNASS